MRPAAVWNIEDNGGCRTATHYRSCRIGKRRPHQKQQQVMAALFNHGHFSNPLCQSRDPTIDELRA
jgi:hypothetical protein